MGGESPHRLPVVRGRKILSHKEMSLHERVISSTAVQRSVSETEVSISNRRSVSTLTDEDGALEAKTSLARG